MNLDALEKKLLAAARFDAPSEQVPYAFEKRVIARLLGAAPVDVWTVWGRILWRAAISCLAIMLLSSLWTIWSARSSRSSPADFSQDFEHAVFVMADQIDDSE